MIKLQTNNIAAMLDDVAERCPDRHALVFGDQTITFGELLMQVKQCAHLLNSHGLKIGERVIIMIPMSPKLYVTLLAVIRCGAVAVFVDPWISMRQIAAFSAFAEPSCFIGVPKSHLLRLLNPKLVNIKISMSTGSVRLGIPARYSLTDIEEHPAEALPTPVAENDSALITFTSGSSGIPKGANRTHGFLKAQHEALCHELNYNDNDIDMPMFPVFALRNIAAGITSVIPEMDFRKVAEVNPALINQQIQKNNVTIITASPPFIDRLATLEKTPSLRKIMTGGAPVTTKQLREWRLFFPNTEIDIIYGSTEAEPVAHISAQERIEAESADGFCCGKPTSLVKTCIIEIRKNRIAPDELNKLILPQGETGELLVSGDHVCRDYFNNPDAVKENKIIESDGTCWHRMGDTGYFDSDGRFFLTGRVHSTIIRDGKVLHAQLIEAEIGKQIPEAERIAALEQNGKLLIVVQNENHQNKNYNIDADKIIFTTKPLPLDPRHNSKIDYNKLHNLIEKGKI